MLIFVLICVIIAKNIHYIWLGVFYTEKFINIGRTEHAVALFGNFDENIKLIEKELGISYPTVKKILDEVSAVLGIASPNKETRESVLAKLKNDEISFEEAEALLDNMKGI